MFISFVRRRGARPAAEHAAGTLCGRADCGPSAAASRSCHRLADSGRNISNDILEIIAERVQSNIRELEGALNRIIAFADLSGTSLTPNLVEVALADLLPQHGDMEPDEVVNQVAQYYKLSRDKLLSLDRSRDVAQPRQVAMYLLREDAHVSYPQIGEVLGGRDHTTVMYAVDKIKKVILDDAGSKISRDINQIRRQLRNQTAMV